MSNLYGNASQEATEVTLLRGLLDGLQEAILLLDCGGVLHFANRRAFAVLEKFGGSVSVGEPLARAFVGKERVLDDALQALWAADAPEEVSIGVHSAQGTPVRLTYSRLALPTRYAKVVLDCCPMSFFDIKQEARAAYILEATNVGTWEWNTQTGETVFNARWAEMLGYTLEEIQPMHIEIWEKYCHPDDLRTVNELLQRHFAGETDFYAHELRMRHKSGEWIWVFDKGKVLRWTDDGKPLLMFGTHQDITEKKRMELLLQQQNERLTDNERHLRQYLKELKANKAYLKMVIDSMPVGVYTTDNEGRISYFNVAAAAMWERSPALGVEKWCGSAKLFDKNGEALPHHMCPMATAIQTKTRQYAQEAILETPTGKRVHFLAHATPFLDAEGGLIGGINVLVDITAMKQQEAQLRESQLFAEIIIENLPLMLFVKEAETLRFVSLNKAGEELVGYPREELLGKSDYDFFPKKEADFFTANDLNVLKSLRPMDIMEEPIDTLHHGRRYLHTRKVPILDLHGKPKYLLGISEDVTERKQAQRLLLQKNQDLARAEEELKSIIRELRKANQTLGLNQLSLSKAQRLAKVGSWEYDPENNVLECSKEYFRIFELDEQTQDVRAATMQKIHPEDSHVLEQIFRGIQAGNDTFQYEHRVMGEKATKYLSGVGEVLRNGVGKIVRLRGTVQDITERKEAQEAIRQEKERFEDIVESTEGIVWEVDFATMQFTFVSNYAERITGYPIERWYEPDFWAKNLHPEDANAAIEYCMRKSINMEPHSFEYRFIAADGRVIWLRDIVNIVGEQSPPKLLRGIMIDITKQKEYEHEQRLAYTRLAKAETELTKMVEDLQVVNTQLKHNEYSLNKAQSLAKIGSWEFDLETFDLAWSREHYHIFELSPDIDKGLLYHAYRSKIHPEDLDRLNEVVQRAQAYGEGFSYDHRVVCLDGTIKYVVGTGEVVRNGAGKPTLLRGTVQDITERKKQEKIILETNARLLLLEQFIDFTMDAMQVSDESGKLLYINKVASERLGIPQAEAGKYYVRDFETIFKTDEAWTRHVEELKATNFLFVEGLNLNQRTGETFPVEVTVRHVVIEGKGHIIATSRDISERKQMERELYRLSLVAKRTSNSVIITGADRKITWVNEGFTRLTAYTLKDVLGKTPRMFQFEQTDQSIIQATNEQLEKLQGTRFEVLNKGKDGRVYWVDTEVQPIFDKQRVHTGFIAVQTDITARKEHEAKIQAQNKALRDIAFFQSHILRRPVANVMGLCSLIEMAFADSELLSELPDYIRLLSQSILEVDEIIHQIVGKANAIEDL